MINEKSRKKSALIIATCSLAIMAIASGIIINDKTAIDANADAPNEVYNNETVLNNGIQYKSIGVYNEEESNVNANDNVELSEKSNSVINCELEIHSNQKPIYTMEDVDRIIDKGIIRQSRVGKEVINTDLYVDNIKNGSMDMNSLEAKSYIYHQMLNSIDYYNDAEGSLTYALNLSSPIEIKFQTNIKQGTSVERESQSDIPVCEFYVSDGIMYSIDLVSKKYTETFCATPVEFTVSDNDRIVLLDNGESMKINRNDLTNLGVSGNSCLFPQSYATTYLSDFDTWSVSELIEMFGRPCVSIEGKDNECSFYGIIDLDTGVMMRFEKFDKNNDSLGYVKVNSISIDNNVVVNKFDKNGYTAE